MKASSSKKISPRFEYKGCGFPVILRNVPMKQVMGEWIVDLDMHAIDDHVAFLLAQKHTRMTGREVEFVRKWASWSMRDMAEKLSVSHVAVHKWEIAKDKASNMDVNTEKVLRILVFRRLGFSPKQTLQIILELRAEAIATRAVPLDFDAKDLRKAS
jgi:DNA-binding transcriptional regulator YiaG